MAAEHTTSIIHHSSRPRKENHDYDAIIVGAGIGGLTCAAFLAQAGLKTLVVEQHFKAGGNVTSYKREGFTFDVPNIIGGLREGAPVRNILSHLGVEQDFIEVERPFIFQFPGYRVSVFSDIEKYKEELIRNFPKEKQGIIQYLKTMNEIWKDMLSSPHTLKWYHYPLFPLLHPRVLKYKDLTFERFIDRFFKDEKLKEIVASGWGFLGLPSSRISLLNMLGMYMSYHTGGAWYPNGGYQTFANSVATAFKKFGGELKLNTRVSKIVVGNGQARGIELEDGTRISAREVISNADSQKTFLNLIGQEHLPPNYYRKIQGLRMSDSGIAVHLGIKMDISGIDLNCGYIMDFPRFGEVNSRFEAARRGEMVFETGNIGMGISVPSLRHAPSDSGKDKHVVELVAYPVPWNFKKNGRSSEAYESLKEKVSNALIAEAERTIPGLSASILIKEVATPLTYERYTGATNGAWYDAECTPDQGGSHRLAAKTPIKGLWLTGAKTSLGAGMFASINTGLFTADSILKGALTGGKFL